MTQSRATSDHLVQIMSEFRSVVSEMAALRGELSAFKATVGPIVNVIQGNGQRPPLAQSLAVLQRDVEHSSAALEEIRGSVRSLKDKIDASERTDRSTRATIIVACISGLCGLLASLISLLKH